MAIVDGMGVDAENTNRELLDAREDDIAEGRIGLANILAVSGPFITNIQRSLNALAFFMGGDVEGVFNLLPIWTNNDVGSSSDDLLDRAEALTERFNESTGHVHDGSAGNGGLIEGASIINVPLRGYFKQGVDIVGATGSSTVVTADFATETPSINSTIEGAVVSAVRNKVILRQATGVNAGDNITDGLGNQVYGRLTEASGVWTLSYFVDLAGVETAHSFAVAQDVRYYYQKLYQLLFNAPTYSELAVIPSDNVTADVIDAGPTDRGVVTTVSQTFAGDKTFQDAVIHDGDLLLNEFDDTTSTGPAIAHPGKAVLRLSNAGLTEIETITAPVRGKTLVLINDTGDIVTVKNDTGATAAQRVLTGTAADLSLADGACLLLVYEVNSLRWRVIGGSGSGGGLGKQESLAGTVDGINDTFGPLSYTPSDEDSVLVIVDRLIIETAGWSLSGLDVVFAPGFIPQPGQTVYVFYLTAGVGAVPAPSGVQYVTYHTITAPELAAKEITLAATPASPSKVILDTIGGGAQIYSTDFTVSGATLSWAGLGLDGVLIVGNVLRIGFFS